MNEPLFRTMSGQITTHIRERILSGAYAPGTALLQDSIAAEFGVSKIPVREALVQLRAEGLVDIFAHRGFQVRPLSASEVEEIFRLRLQVEPDAVAQGCKKAEPPDVEAVQTVLRRLNYSLSATDLKAAGELNRQFHLELTVPRLHPVTADVLNRLHVLSERYVRLHLAPNDRVSRATKEHAALYEAWAAGKAKEASRLTQMHIEATRRDLAEFLSNAPSG